jgi:predicted transcriptional regulator
MRIKKFNEILKELSIRKVDLANFMKKPYQTIYDHLSGVVSNDSYDKALEEYCEIQIKKYRKFKKKVKRMRKTKNASRKTGEKT